MEAPSPIEASPKKGAAIAAEAPLSNPGAEDLALPNLIVIGAQKCGTSGLHYYLSLHPEVSMSATKELNFFIAERNYPRGLGWYSRHFDPSARCRGESSPNYTAYPQHLGVPERMAATVPDARLVYIVRDPLERMAAHWVHNYAKRREKGGLRETLLHQNTSYVSRSKYHMQLQRFLACYPEEQILVLDQQDLRDERMTTLRRLFEFAGVDPSFEHPKFGQLRHSTSRKKRATRLGMRVQRASRTRGGRRVPRKAWLAMDVALPLSRPIDKPTGIAEALGEEVLEVLHADAEALRAQTGRYFAHWSV